MERQSIPSINGEEILTFETLSRKDFPGRFSGLFRNQLIPEMTQKVSKHAELIFPLKIICDFFPGNSEKHFYVFPELVSSTAVSEKFDQI